MQKNFSFVRFKRFYYSCHCVVPQTSPLLPVSLISTLLRSFSSLIPPLSNILLLVSSVALPPLVRYAENQQLLEEAESTKQALHNTVYTLRAELKKRGIRVPTMDLGSGFGMMGGDFGLDERYYFVRTNTI